MCGLVGIMSSNMTLKHKDVLADMLYLDTWRGRDSTGVAAIRHNADTSVMKSTVPGYEFVEGPKLGEFLKANDFLWIGHNRFGTIGKNCKTNAHPFTIDDEDGGCLVVGAHNGTLKNKHVLTDSHKFGTDSEALYNEIALNGLEKAIAKVEGAWALTYYDHLEEEFRVLRNKERPLFYAWSEDRKTLFWASEIWMIRIATSRRDIKLHEDKVISFNEDTLYGFAAPEKMNDEIKVTTRKGGVVGKETPAFFQGSGTGGRIGSTTHTQTTQTTQQGSHRPLTGNYGASGGMAGTGYGPDKVWDQTSRTWVPKGTPPQTSTALSGTPTSNTGGRPPLTSGTGSTPPRGTAGSTAGDNNAPPKVVPIGSAKTYKGFNGTALSLSELKDQLANGCAWCEQEMIDPTDRFAWFAPHKPVCGKCISGEHGTERDPTYAAIFAIPASASIN